MMYYISKRNAADQAIILNYTIIMKITKVPFLAVPFLNPRRLTTSELRFGDINRVCIILEISQAFI